MYNTNIRTPYPNELYHHGIKGQRWGVRRFQNPNGTLTAAGKKRYLLDLESRPGDGTVSITDHYGNRYVTTGKLATYHTPYGGEINYEKLSGPGTGDSGIPEENIIKMYRDGIPVSVICRNYPSLPKSLIEAVCEQADWNITAHYKRVKEVTRRQDEAALQSSLRFAEQIRSRGESAANKQIEASKNTPLTQLLKSVSKTFSEIKTKIERLLDRL